MKKTNIDSSSWSFGQSKMNRGTPFIIYTLDDDGLLRGNSNKDSLGNPKKFVVFADSAPKKPDVAYSQPGGGLVQLKWKNLDVKDDSLTQFAITLGTSDIGCNDTLISWTAANNATFQKSGGWMTYTFNPNDLARTPHYATDFYFMVIARDARGTKSRSNNGTGILISYP